MSTGDLNRSQPPASPRAVTAAGRKRPSRVRLSPAEHRRLSVQTWESLFQSQVAVMQLLRENPVFRQLSMREYDVLYTLSRCPDGWLRLHELNRHVLLTQPSISRLVERLEAQGLLQRRIAEDDRRGVLIGLTEAGRQMQRELGREHVKDIHRLIGSALSPKEMKQLAALTHKLKLAVQDES
ncbi:MarR family transcriptional regulator [Acaricomes phytoseiuli]|uniref:MarR family winged helix-turn-helix transcriptional regulator n=1 Tax=Acaricomes phytoseiuli TaxID=291968 RepID=UPI0009FE2B04|nr:MarR family transcriptional regulator [Acaricomes phytoseiuli]MCW1249302.1 MarR family transcriptional regulator [Acaricomes phytoseiuli]